ncbi:MAG: hypothetical protein HY785_09980 [Oscillatoriophycideae cyanobacterium NC_groundwater_1537_Pr4_S-0.65um_50_18]|nr:hypothetical protein [Oscillatoriophycideae cyanobacterium NC_groundwater_1537_Pr4_S-0.65um_50_18]
MTFRPELIDELLKEYRNPALLKSNDFSTREPAFEIARPLPNQQRPQS